MGAVVPLLDVYAVCVTCGRTAESLPPLRELDRKELVVTKRRELALRVDSPCACRACGGTRLELRVEDRTGDA